MPKTPLTKAHFDAPGLIAAIHAQEIGLRISTNNPRRFREILYAAARETNQRVHIYQCRRSPRAFLVLKQAFGGATPLPEETDDGREG